MRITAPELVLMVKGLIPPDRNPVEATCWYISYRQAEVVGELTHRDLAEYIRDGEPLGGPIKNLIDIASWMDDVSDGYDDAEFYRWLHQDVKSFFQPDNMQSVGSKVQG